MWVVYTKVAVVRLLTAAPKSRCPTSTLVLNVADKNLTEVVCI